MKKENVRKSKMKYQNTTKGRKKQNEAQNRWKRKRKQRAIDYKGGVCSRCGYSICINALEFHHLDPTNKEAAISTYLRNKKNWKSMKIELDKCILLCANSHRELHFFDVK